MHVLREKNQILNHFSKIQLKCMFHPQSSPCYADACDITDLTVVRKKVTFNDIFPVTNLSDLPILAVCFPVTSTKHS